MNLYFLNLIQDSKFQERKRNRALIFDCEFPTDIPSFLKRFPSYRNCDLIKDHYNAICYRRVGDIVGANRSYFVTNEICPYFWEDIVRVIDLHPHIRNKIKRNPKIKIGKNRYQVQSTSKSEKELASFLLTINLPL
jgi:hypothetical protein